jgi:hypothetical protein
MTKENFTKAQLQQIATQKEIKFSSKATKEDLLNLIEDKKKPTVGKSFAGEY